ncbi:MAG: hypothetical protein IT385_28950 [Deltaproteobacteria bacterium]|nr:hypothetical protein [Deltaproteobacteria bacterium]
MAIGTRRALVILVIMFGAPSSRASEDARWTFFPILTYSPETSFGAGAGAIHGFALDGAPTPPSSFAVDLMATLEAQLVLRARLELEGEAWLARTALRAQRFPTRFFPEGAHASDGGEPLDEITLDLELEGRWRATRALSFGGRCALWWDDVLEVEDGGLLDTRRPLGLGAWLAAGCGPALALDTRDDTRSTRCGALVEVSSVAWTGVSGIDFEALETRVDVRAFGSLGSHVFGAQLLVEATLGDEPFQLVPRLGGASRLRGWYDGHLRGRHAALAQVEWRAPLVWKLRSAVFAAVGEAADDWSIDRLRFGVGAGVRLDLDPRAGAILRLDVAWGSGLGVYFEIGEAF